MKRRDFVGAVGAGLVGLIPGHTRDASSALTSSTSAFRPLRPSAPRFIERWSWAMGQPVHLMLFAESDDAGYQAAAAALAELRRVEGRLSRFDDRSDLAELNRRAGLGPFRADRDLLAVLSSAERHRRQTGGALNVAVEPLMRAWGFHRPRAKAPSEAEIAGAREAVTQAVVIIRGDQVTLPASHTSLDLGGIGVGYGLDRVAAVLKQEGIQRAFVDVSGDCVAIGSPPGENGWPVDIADSERPGTVLASVRLCNQALATSANTVSVVRYGRLLVGHVMDPATGHAAVSRRQATVIASTGLDADALSTAALVSTDVPVLNVDLHGFSSRTLPQSLDSVLSPQS